MNISVQTRVTNSLRFLMLLIFCSTAMADTDTQDVLWFDDFSDTGGDSHLTRTDDMILITLEAAGLVPGDAHTLWWIVFNDPEGCSDPGCGENDIFTPEGELNEAGVIAAQIAIGNASGNVAKSDGTLEFGGSLTQDAGADGHQVLFGAGFGDYMLTASPDDAEVHVIVQTHGQARGGKKLREQLSMVDSNCTPACADIQVAVHLP